MTLTTNNRIIKLSTVKASVPFLIVGVVCFCSVVRGQPTQFLDSLHAKVGTIVSVASQDYQPLWLVSNRWGTISDQQFDVSTYLSLRNKHIFKNKSPISQYYSMFKNQSIASISYGVTVYNNQHLQKTFLQEGYVKANWYSLQLAVGRYKEITGEGDSQLSSGSLGISSNALPIPKVSLGFAEYVDVPFLAPGWLQVKGQFSNGWMENDSLIQGAYLHQRSFYLRIGKGRLVNTRSFTTLNLYGGLNQFVIWGGKNAEGERLPGEWKDLFTRVAVPGNNLGLFDYGATLTTRDFKLTAYTQVPFESINNMNPVRFKDRLVGISWSTQKTDALLSSITLEGVNTTWQNVKSPTAKTDYNFYNNARYPSGWSYHGNIIGTPLFFDHQRAIHYFGESYTSQAAYNWNIANNRINAVHIGLKGYLFNDLTSLSYRTLFTHTINNGNYYDGYWVPNNKNQSYFMQELTFQLNALKIKGTLGLDVGNLTTNVGSMLGIEYDLNYKPDHRDLGPVRYRKRIRSIRRRR